TGHQSVAPPRSATASRCAPSQGSRLLGIAPAPAAAPWFRPPESVGNHVNILSTTVVLRYHDSKDTAPDPNSNAQYRHYRKATFTALVRLRNLGINRGQGSQVGRVASCFIYWRPP